MNVSSFFLSKKNRFYSTFRFEYAFCYKKFKSFESLLRLLMKMKSSLLEEVPTKDFESDLNQCKGGIYQISLGLVERAWMFVLEYKQQVKYSLFKPTRLIAFTALKRLLKTISTHNLLVKGNDFPVD